MPRKRKAVEQALRAKGFVQVDNDHHFFVFMTADGRRTRVRTKTSHSSKMKDIPDSILALMAHQCRVPKSVFLDLVDCPLGRDAYEALLTVSGEL